MSRATLSVTAIRQGSVIDHIPAGCAPRIISLLHLQSYERQVTVGLHLPSKSMRRKDIIKIEGREITESEGERIAVFAPRATIVIIDEYVIAKKFVVTTPETIEDVFVCPFTQCITNRESVPTVFSVTRYGGLLSMRCTFCERSYTDKDMKESRQ